MTTNKEIKTAQSNDTPQQNRRDFVSKFGKLAVVTPIAVTTLMSTYSSKAMASTFDGDDGGTI